MKVLFIGNSYTYYNDLPGEFAKICAENGVSAETEMIAAGGYTLAHHASPGNDCGRRVREIAEKGESFDFIVVQEQSVRPAESPEAFYKSLSDFIVLLRGTGAQFVLYETWGRADGSETLTSHGWTHEEMQARLFASYSQAARENGCLLAPCGESFSQAYRRGEEVFVADGSHPSPLGTHIAAREIFNAVAMGAK